MTGNIDAIPVVSPQLDLIRDNPELSFPANGPDFVFIGWSHTAENVPTITPLLEDCDIIAVELASIRANYALGELPSTCAAHNQAIYNRILNGSASNREKQIIANAAEAGEVTAMVTQRFAKTGKKIVYIDDFANSDTNIIDIERHAPWRSDHADDASYVKVYKDYVAQESEFLRKREQASLLQLHTLAERYADSQKTVKIGIVYGAAHSPVSIALKQLGANVERHFLCPFTAYLRTSEFLIRCIRFNLVDPADIPDADFISAGEIDDALILLDMVFPEKNLTDLNNQCIGRVIMSAWRSNPDQVKEQISALSRSAYVGLNPIKNRRFKQTAQTTLKLVQTSSRLPLRKD